MPSRHDSSVARLRGRLSLLAHLPSWAYAQLVAVVFIVIDDDLMDAMPDPLAVNRTRVTAYRHAGARSRACINPRK